MNFRLGLTLALTCLLSACASRPRALEFTDLPNLEGSTWDEGQVRLGGFSGLTLEKYDPATHKMTFLTNTDRGPNLTDLPKGGREYRAFLVPNFAPEIVRFEYDPKTNALHVLNRIPIKWAPNGRPASGLPLPPGPDAAHEEIPVDMRGHPLKATPYGLDVESITIAPNGNFWMSEEYGPSLIELSPQGTVIRHVKPSQFPPFFRDEQMNRGFEIVAVRKSNIFTMLESPTKRLEKTRRALALEYDPQKNKTVAVYAYELADDGAQKLSDACTDKLDRLFVVEQNTRTDATGVHKIYELDFSKATNLIGTKLTDDDIVKATPITKKLKVDLVKKGLNRDKFEGLACLADGSFALVNDDDFGIDGVEDKATHRLKAIPSQRKPEFFIVSP